MAGADLLSEPSLAWQPDKGRRDRLARAAAGGERSHAQDAQHRSMARPHPLAHRDRAALGLNASKDGSEGKTSQTV